MPPTKGTITVNGRPFVQHTHPLRELGALLEARGVHPGRSARVHLLALAATAGIGAGRVDEVIDMVGLSDVATKRVGAFSLGMGQRLGTASALLADPDALQLDEPVNGLDPDGVRWIRNLLRGFAEGRVLRPAGAARPRHGSSATPSCWSDRCKLESVAYRPPACSRSSWVPCSTTQPPSMTRMRSARRMVDSR